MIIAIDLDGILAEYDEWRGHNHFGKPIKKNIEEIKRLHKDGFTLILFTTRLNPQNAQERMDLPKTEQKISEWLKRMGIRKCFSKLTGRKPIARYYVDDRAVTSFAELRRQMGGESEVEKDSDGVGYNRYVASFVFIVAGFALMIEHLVTWGRFDAAWGHEVIGLLIILVGYLIGIRFTKKMKPTEKISSKEADGVIGLHSQLINQTDKPLDYGKLKDVVLDELERKIRDDFNSEVYPLEIVIEPCGNKHTFNTREDIPNESIPCACGDPKHWIIKYSEGD